MPWNKIWLGTTDGAFSTSTNWQKISVRNSSYAWTASGSGTSNYYLRTSGGSDPAIGAAPGGVYLDGTLATAGTLGALTAGQWAYGDSDALGYSTIYVRTSGSVDPDSLARDYVQFQAVPNGADAVTISGNAVSGITSGLDQSALSAAAWRIESGFRNLAIGSQSQPLRITPASLVIEGSGTSVWYIDIGSANISPEIRSCPTGSNGRSGFYLTGSNIATVTLAAGSLGVAAQLGDTSTLATANVLGGELVCGSGTTLTTVNVSGGVVYLDCSLTTLTATAGTTELRLAAAATTINGRGGKIVDRSTGTHVTVTLDGSTLDFSKLLSSKTVTNLKLNTGTIIENPDKTTYTTWVEPSLPGTLSRA